MKKYILLITLALIVAPLIAAGCASPSSPSPSPSATTSTATSSVTAAVSTATSSPSAAASASPTASPTAITSASQQTYSVSIISYAFQPSTLAIPRGATVKWTNNAPIAHTVTSDSGAFDSGTLSPGATYTHQFNQAGIYSYHCSIHPTLMRATITVQ